MLVILSINSRCDGGPVGIGLIFPRDVGLQDASQFNLGVDGAVLVKVVIPNVICGVLHSAMSQRQEC